MIVGVCYSGLGLACSGLKWALEAGPLGELFTPLNL